MATITPQDYNGFRFIKFLNVCGRRVLYKVFLLGTPDKPPGTTLDQFLTDSGKRGKFNKTQKELIADSPDGSKFDVTLLFLSIKLACKNVAEFNDPKWNTPSSEMEYYVTAIKDTRNDALHGQLSITDEEFLLKTNNLRELLTNCLKTSGERYGRDQAEVNKEIKQVEEDLDNISQEILGEEDLIKYCSDKLRQLMIEDSRKKLKEVYQNIVYINPVSFITNNLRLKVEEIFIDIEVKRRKRDGGHIQYRDLLQLVQESVVPPSVNTASQQHSPAVHHTTSAAYPQGPSARPQILVVEGVAGSGKTTLVTMVTHDWIKEGQDKIKGLDNYDLMLWVQCRDSTIHTYQHLLDRLMPDVSLKFRNLLQRLMKLCKLLIVVDGLDEINKNSRELVNSLLHEFKNSPHTAFLCTSRPEKLEMFKRTIPQEYNVINAELRGILKDQILKFVRLSHMEIEKQTKSNRSTEQLVEAVKKLTGLQEHLSLPMNLILLVYIWDQAPDELNMTTITQTELYHKIHQLCQSKLLERLANHRQTKDMSRDDLEDGIQEVLKVIYRTALESLSRDKLILEKETVKQVKSACKSRGLPHEELLSAFLSLKPTWTWEGVQERYSAPHKGVQDYYSAVHVVTTLKCQLQSTALPSSYNSRTTPPVSSQPPVQSSSTPVSPSPASPCTIRQVLTETITPVKVDMATYQNVVVHVAGLLHLTLDQVPEALVQEAVELLHESGMRNEDQWLDLLENTKVSPVTARAVAPFLNTGDVINISDRRVESYAALLPHLQPCWVAVDIMSDPDDLACLPDLLAGLARHRCILLWLRHHYDHDHTTTSDDLLQRIQPRNDLRVFRGRLSGDGLEALPPTLTELQLAVVSDDHARCLLPRLNAALTSQLPRLLIFGLRVAAAVSPAALVPLHIRSREALVPLHNSSQEELVPLPGSRLTVDLELSDVSNAGVSRACDVASDLQPPGGYYTIKFPRTTMTEAGWRDLTLGLDHRRVKVVKPPRDPDNLTCHLRD